jgi:SAM-dependent methyltransferase
MDAGGRSMSGSADSIAGRPRDTCPICGARGDVRYAELPDLWHGVPGMWDVRWCAPCESLWIDPEPLETEVTRLYPESYSTHVPSWDVLDGGPGRIGALRRGLKLQILATSYRYRAWNQQGLLRAAGIILSSLPPVRRRVGLNNVRLLGAPCGRLLDVGCGNGSFLRTMSRLGWDVEGIEPDEVAAAVARRSGLMVEVGPLRSCRLRAECYDAITLHHVLEHLGDPADALNRLAVGLKPGGRLISISPNPTAVTSRRFGRWWRALDVPRHLVLPGRRGLLRMASRAGLRAGVTTSARITPWNTRESLAASRGGSPSPLLGGLWAMMMTAAAAAGGQGDELVLEARRP